VIFDEGKPLSVPSAHAAELRLREGMELGGETYAEIKRADAKLRALRALGARDMSKRELIAKIAYTCEDLTLANEIAEWCEEMELIDDAEYAASVVRRCAARGYGADRVRDELRRHSVDMELQDAALAGMPDMGDAAYKLYSSKMNGADADGAEARKAARMMRGRGYGWDDISRARERYREAAGDAD
jgi:regulatory protein